jgi:hypothetical protein
MLYVLILRLTMRITAQAHIFIGGGALEGSECECYTNENLKWKKFNTEITDFGSTKLNTE